MLGKIAVVFSSIALALAILLVSIFQGAEPRKAFSSSTPTPEMQEMQEEIDIDYQLIYPGKILPDHPLWYLKALRDKLQYLVTFKPEKKAELNLLFADKRLGMAVALMEKDKVDLAYTTLTKSEKYMEEVLKNEPQDVDFLNRFAKASLKHRQVIEQQILSSVPGDLRPEVIKTCDYSKNSYNNARDVLRSKGEKAPENPFESE